VMIILKQHFSTHSVHIKLIVLTIQLLFSMLFTILIDL